MVNKINLPAKENEVQIKINELVDDKQDVISDLATIRSGAALGATALQSGDNISELVNNAGYLVNTATGSDSLVILGNETGSLKSSSVGIGVSSTVAMFGVSVGYGANNNGLGVSIGYSSTASAATGAVTLGAYSSAGLVSNYSIAIGYQAIVSDAKSYAIQLGQGTNSEANSFYVSTSASDNWKMLGSDGLIPDARISSNIARAADVVHKTGTETITGEKGFTTNPWIFNTSPGILLKNTNLDVTTTSVSENLYANCTFYDKNDTTFANVYTAQYTNGTRALNLLLLGTGFENGVLSLRWDSSNGFYAIAPASDVNTSIVTTVNKSKGANGYFKLGNGLIIQWGIASGSGTSRTVTLPTAFTSTNYKVTVSPHNGNIPATVFGVYSETTTTFNILSSSGSGMNINWIAIGY